MNDQRGKLQQRFELSHRFANFGESIRSFRVEGFRCHKSTIIEPKSPIVDFCGLNGVGKSTLLQIVASAYKNSAGQSFSVHDFFDKNSLDDPVESNARIGPPLLQSQV